MKISSDNKVELYRNLTYSILSESTIALVISLGGIISQNQLILNITAPLGIINGIMLNVSICLLETEKSNNADKEVQEIRKLYDIFLNNYNSMRKIFCFNDPYEINEMFIYLRDNGYLSKDKTYTREDKSNDIANIVGTQIILGSGVCRHSTEMLKDILHKAEIEAYYLPTLVSKENSFNIFSNHAIVFAVKNNEFYFLDSNKKRTYYMLDKKYLTDDDIKILINLGIRVNKGTLINLGVHSYDSFKQMKERLKEPYPVASKEEMKEKQSNALNICKANIDIFEQFYHDNKDIYEEINSKILSYRNKEY